MKKQTKNKKGAECVDVHKIHLILFSNFYFFFSYKSRPKYIQENQFLKIFI